MGYVAKSSSKLLHYTAYQRSILLFFCFAGPHGVAMAHGILVPQSGFEPYPLKWKCRVLTDRPSGKSQKSVGVIG